MGRYTTPAAVASALGRTFTPEQDAEASLWIAAAESWIDAEYGPWNTSTPITGELHEASGPIVYLKQKPVASVQSVAARPPVIGSAATALAATAYELLDAANGALWTGVARGWLVTVAYTPAIPMDARVERAATMLAGAWLRPVLDVVSGDIKRYSIGQELTVEYRDAASSAATTAVPLDVRELLDSAAAARSGGLVFA